MMKHAKTYQTGYHTQQNIHTQHTQGGSSSQGEEQGGMHLPPSPSPQLGEGMAFRAGNASVIQNTMDNTGIVLTKVFDEIFNNFTLFED